jgi:hypothetical protein
MLPSPRDIKIEPRPEDYKYAANPAKGLSGDPSKPPRKQYTLMKQMPLPEGKPRFLRHSNSVEDIEGAKSRALYRGVAKNILDINDIDGCKPKSWKQRDIQNYNVMDWSDVNDKRSTAYIRIPDMSFKRPKEGFYTRVMPKSTRYSQDWQKDKLDIFKKDQATNYLYPKRFSYADTDAASWKSHITRDFEPHLPDHYGIGTMKKSIE